MVFFILVGAVLPFVNSTFQQTETFQDFGNFTGNVTDSAKELSDKTIEPTWLNPVGSLNALSVLASILKMFFWTFGDLPFWIDIVLFIPLRLIFVAIIARNIWIGGGG